MGDQKSLRIYKELMAGNFEVNTHQLFAMDTNLTETNNALKTLLNGIKTYKAKTTIFESMAKDNPNSKRSQKSLDSINKFRKLVSSNAKQHSAIKNKAASQIKLSQIRSKALKTEDKASKILNYGNYALRKELNDERANDQFEIDDKVALNVFDPQKDDDFGARAPGKLKKTWNRISKRFEYSDPDSSSGKKRYNPIERGLTYDKWLKKANAGKIKNIASESTSVQSHKSELKSDGKIFKERSKREKYESFKNSKVDDNDDNKPAKRFERGAKNIKSNDKFGTRNNGNKSNSKFSKQSKPGVKKAKNVPKRGKISKKKH